MTKIERLTVESQALELFLEKQAEIYCNLHDKGKLALAERQWTRYLAIKGMCEAKARELWLANDADRNGYTFFTNQ